MSIAWFSTGRDEAALTLLEATLEGIRREALSVEISLIVTNRAQGEGLWSDRLIAAARLANIPCVTFSSSRFQPQLRKNDRRAWRTAYHAALHEQLAGHEFAVGMLVGYMLMVDGVFCEDHLLLNLHPSIPRGPVGTWEDVIWAIIRDRPSRFGAMIHVVTEQLDRGPCITYWSFPLTGPRWSSLWDQLVLDTRVRTIDDIREFESADYPLFQTLRAEEFAVEAPLILKTLSTIAGTADISLTHQGLIQAGSILTPVDVCDISQ